jgi:hypothetical protein
MKDPKCAELRALEPQVLLPDGTPFCTWERPRRYLSTYHVAKEHPQASDANDGSESAPWKTLGRAAEALQPGERVLVHTGLYRETVRPARGGQGPEQMVGYFAAPGQAPVVSGAEIYLGPWQLSARWKPPAEATASQRVFHLRLPPEWFVGYLPFGMVNMPQHHLDMGWGRGFPEEPRMKLLLKRGLIFQDGRRLTQVLTWSELFKRAGSYWCEANGLDVHVRPFEDTEPASSQWAVTTREQGFVPAFEGTSFIELEGLTFEHYADGFTWPQHAAVSAGGGTHWLISGCTIRQVNANGIDFGQHHPMRVDEGGHGHHILRGNTIEACGLSGLCATARPLSNVLVEDNLIIGAGWHGVERMWESAAIKQHLCKDCLYRRNIIEGSQDATGIWLDNGIENTRVTQNLITDTRSGFGGIFIEYSKVTRVLVDHNIILGSRRVQPFGAAEGDEPVNGGHGIYEHDCDRMTVAHNLIADCEGTAVMLRLGRTERFMHTGRGGVCRDHHIQNNLIVGCDRCVEFARPQNLAEGNAYASAKGQAPWRVHEPVENMDFEGWQEFLGHDRRGALVGAVVKYDASLRRLRVELEGALPSVPPLSPGLLDFFDHERRAGDTRPGPFAELSGTSWEGSVDPRRSGSVVRSTGEG